MNDRPIIPHRARESDAKHAANHAFPGLNQDSIELDVLRAKLRRIARDLERIARGPETMPNADLLTPEELAVLKSGGTVIINETSETRVEAPSFDPSPVRSQHPWAAFLEARCRAIDHYHALGQSDAEILTSLNLADVLHVRRLRERDRDACFPAPFSYVLVHERLLKEVAAFLQWHASKVPGIKRVIKILRAGEMPDADLRALRSRR